MIISKIDFKFDLVFCFIIDSIIIIFLILHFVKIQFLYRIQNVNKIV